MLSTDWYRFSGAAGNQMVESCVDMYRCGTIYPGWLDGSHPTVNEGAVQRRVCFSYYVYGGDCCSLSTYIRVRNCGGFFVYQLKPLTVCNSRYCGYMDHRHQRHQVHFSFFLFFFSSCEERIRHLPIKQITDTLLPFIWLKWTPSFLAYCHPYSPQINPPMREFIRQPLTTFVWLK